MVKTLLSKNIVKIYDSGKVFNKVREVYDLFNYLETAVTNFEYPIVSNLGRVRYEQFVKGINSSKVEGFVLDKLMFELRGDDYKRKLFATKIAIALRKLSKIELIVFSYSVYDNLDTESIAELINYGTTKIKEIKRSAFIKFLIALNLDKECLKGGDDVLVNNYFKDKVMTAQV